MSEPTVKRWPPNTLALVLAAVLLLICGTLMLGVVWCLFYLRIPAAPFWSQNWGNVITAIGLLVSVAGFALALAWAKEATTAARAAKKAADQARASVYNFDSIVELAKAITLLDQITQHHRECLWNRLPHLYAENRRRLKALTNYVSPLDDVQKASISSVSIILNDIYNCIDVFIQKGKGTRPPQSTGWLAVLKEQSDKLDSLQGELKSAQGVLHGP